MDTKRICPGCQKPLPPDVPLGLCPECLLKAGFKTGTEAGGENTGFVPPTVEQMAKLFPQLEVVEFIGQGGMGAVYKARQPALDRFVALKILPPRVAGAPGFAERFNREARALARLVHPNIVAVHDFGKAGELPYFIMEFVDGANLRQMERAGRLAPEQALAIVPQICEALQFAHNEGIVHRDIKPENILLDKKGRVKIADFGIAKILGEEAGPSPLTGAKDAVGTPHYMAPEQVEQPATVDHRADIFSLGVVFYEMLTGELPLGKFAPPSKKVQVDVRLDDVVLHALEKEPERRYQQASQVKTDVETIGTRQPGPATGAAPPPAIPTTATAGATRGLIVAPAAGLMVAGVLKLSSLFIAFGLLGTILGNLGLDLPLGIRLPFHLGALAGFGLVLFKVIPALLILFGAFQMIQLRSYAWAVAAAILAIVSCSLVGFPVGIWALIVLSRADVREAFANPSNPKSPASVKWLCLLGTIGLFTTGTDAVATTNLALEGDSKTGTPSTSQTIEAGDEADFTRSLIVEGGGKLTLKVDRGSVHVTGSDQNTVEVQVHREVTRAGHAEAARILKEQGLVLKQEGHEISITAHDPSSLEHRFTGWWGWWRQPHLSVRYEITLPRRFDVRLETAGGSIKVARLRGDVNVKTEGGSLDFNDIEGKIDGQTEGGGIRAVSCKDDLLIRTEGGGITIEQFSGPRVQATTEGGSISAGFAAAPKADSKLHTDGGSVTARLPESAALTLEAHTDGGTVRTDLPVQVEGRFHGDTLKGTIHGGGPLLKLETEGGSIEVLKQ